jgi:hypothetical protein
MVKYCWTVDRYGNIEVVLPGEGGEVVEVLADNIRDDVFHGIVPIAALGRANSQEEAIRDANLAYDRWQRDHSFNGSRNCWGR